MSRSFRKTPIIGCTTSDSDKIGKIQANRKLRVATRHFLVKGREPLPILREISSVWDFPKDGKRFVADWYEWKEMMRK